MALDNICYERSEAILRQKSLIFANSVLENYLLGIATRHSEKDNSFVLNLATKHLEIAESLGARTYHLREKLLAYLRHEIGLKSK